MDYYRDVEKAVLFIEQHLTNEIYVQDVAALVSYSYFHFQRIFQGTMGESIGHYIRTRRLTKAAQELLYTDKKILDIALSLQFETNESFTRAFKHYFKKTPSRYRKDRKETLLGFRPEMQQLIMSPSCLHTSPSIIHLSSIYLEGISFTFNMKHNISQQKWAQLNKELSDIKIKGNRYAVFHSDDACEAYDFHTNSMIQEFIGIEKKELPTHRQKMEEKIIEGGKYLQFTHEGTIEELQKSYAYIWGTWIPKHQYSLSARSDLEIYTEEFLGPMNSLSKIYLLIPIDK